MYNGVFFFLLKDKTSVPETRNEGITKSKIKKNKKNIALKMKCLCTLFLF
jgi:hypothetical protein